MLALHLFCHGYKFFEVWTMAAEKNEKMMDVTGHLSELRSRLMVTAFVFIIFFIIGFIFRKDIYRFFEKDIHIKLTILSPLDTVWIFLAIAGLVAIVLTLPFLAFQLWLFIKPGLTAKEKKATLSYIPAIFLLFVIGLVVGYIVFTNFLFPFLINLNEDMFNEMFTVDKYFRFLFHTMLAFALVLELPIILMFLTSIGFLTPNFLKRTRKYAYFILLVIAGLITPPDLILHVAVTIPLIMFYEISVQLTAIAYRKRLKRQRLYMETYE